MCFGHQASPFSVYWHQQILLSYITNFPYNISQYYTRTQSFQKANLMANKISQLLVPVSISSFDMVYSNKIYLSDKSQFPQENCFVLIKGYVFSYEHSSQISQGKLGVNKKFREFLALSLIDKVQVVYYRPSPTDRFAPIITIKVQMMIPPKERTEVDDQKLIKQFKTKFNNYYISTDQIFVTQFDGVAFILTIQKISGIEQNSHVYISPNTVIESMTNHQQNIKLKSAKIQKKNIFASDFKMESLGIGGLDQQLNSIFRRAFASRRLPHSIVQKFGIKHVKGILLYGPPGTGKTLIARQLSKSLKAKTLNIVNGPDIFSKYVGQSQENIRKLFIPARQDQRKYGQQSPLHMVVFDQIDAICRQRGSDNSGTNAKDAVVNQILTNLDGVQALNNIVVIGMTNRKDLIDEAVLRPGRLEVHVEIGLPNQQGRVQILQIHTKTIVEQNLLDAGVNLKHLAHITKNYTGAEIEAVVKNAASYAMTKNNNIMDFSKNFAIQKGTKVTLMDFEKAIEEVPPAFGIDQQCFETFIKQPLIDYGENFRKVWRTLEKTMNLALKGHCQVSSILLYGEPGVGKSSVAADFAIKCKMPYVKMITPEKYLGVSTSGKINSLNRVFNDSYKSKESVIVIDCLERIIQYVQIGPEFNNYVMQSLMAMIKRVPNDPESRLMIIGTTSDFEAMKFLGIDKMFSLRLRINPLNEKECQIVLRQNLGINHVPIKKLVQFKNVVKEKPKQLWGSLWQKFN